MQIHNSHDVSPFLPNLLTTCSRKGSHLRLQSFTIKTSFLNELSDKLLKEKSDQVLCFLFASCMTERIKMHEMLTFDTRVIQ